MPPPDVSSEYEMAYRAAASVAGRQSLSDLQKALRHFSPPAKSEFEWGAVDALADEVRKRQAENPVL